MIRQTCNSLFAMGALVAAVGWSTTAWADAPATAPAVCPANEGRPMPAGHPAMGGAVTPMAPGAVCPATPGQKLQAGTAATAPATAPATIGSIDLQVNQGTKDGPAIGAAAVTIQLFGDSGAAQKFELKLDANGHATLPNIPLGAALEPVVTLEHAGLTQQSVGTALEPTNPKSQIVMNVYEAAKEAPAWNISMRHVIVHSSPEGLQVTEMVSVNNPTDRIWMGSTQEAIEHVTVALPLPKGITNLELGGGFQEPYAKVAGEQLVSTLPMFPGALQFQMNYTVPVVKGVAEWVIAAPVAVDQLIVFAPADQSTVTVEGAKDGGSVNMGDGPMHMFRGSGIKAGQAVALKFSGISAAAAPAVVAAVGVNWTRNIGAIGAGLVAVIGTVMLVRRPKGAVKA